MVLFLLDKIALHDAKRHIRITNISNNIYIVRFSLNMIRVKRNIEYDREEESSRYCACFGSRYLRTLRTVVFNYTSS